MLGLLVLAGLASAAAMPDIMRAVADSDRFHDDLSDPEDDLPVPETEERAAPADVADQEMGDGAETFRVAVEPGVHIVEGFDPGTDRMEIAMPGQATDLQISLADPETGAPAMLTWEQDDGLVELLFDGLPEVPSDRIGLLIDGLENPFALADAYALQENGPTNPTDPTAPSVAPQEGEEAGDVLRPTDADGPSFPTLQDADDVGEPLRPLEDAPSYDPGADDALQAVDPESPAVPADDLSTGIPLSPTDPDREAEPEPFGSDDGDPLHPIGDVGSFVDAETTLGPTDPNLPAKPTVSETDTGSDPRDPVEKTVSEEIAAEGPDVLSEAAPSPGFDAVDRTEPTDGAHTARKTIRVSAAGTLEDGDMPDVEPGFDGQAPEDGVDRYPGPLPAGQTGPQDDFPDRVDAEVEVASAAIARQAGGTGTIPAAEPAEITEARPFDLIEGFVPGEDVIAVRAEDFAALSFRADADGTGTDIFSAEHLIARVPGVLTLSKSDFVLARESG